MFKNFDAIYGYNAAESYALAISHLADRLRGGGPIQTPWPTDDPGLSRAERRELQERLNAQGYDVGIPDGALGPRTRAAIVAFQTAAGLPADGHAGGRVWRKNFARDALRWEELRRLFLLGVAQCRLNTSQQATVGGLRILAQRLAEIVSERSLEVLADRNVA